MTDAHAREQESKREGRDKTTRETGKREPTQATEARQRQASEGRERRQNESKLEEWLEDIKQIKEMGSTGLRSEVGYEAVNSMR